MDPHTETAVTPFRFLDLCAEIRNDIYEAAIFDFSPPDIFITPEDAERPILRKMSTDVLLLNRKVYWEAREVIVRRGQLIMISVSVQHFTGCFRQLVTALSGITGIHPMYRSLCVMSHRIDRQTSAWELRMRELILQVHPSYEPAEDLEFILHRQDTQFFCRVMMGEFGHLIGKHFVSRATHTLNLNCPPTYAQLESRSVYDAQTSVLQKYRNSLRGLENVMIRGAGTGWESGLYRAVLQDVRSIDDREPTELLAEIRTLEREGSQMLLQTGDVRAADIFWVKALGLCDVARESFSFSDRPHPREFNDFPKAFKSHVERWIQLRHQSGNECAIPLVELFYRLISHRISGALRFIEQGHHLATRYGHAPWYKEIYRDFVRLYCQDLPMFQSFFYVDWSPQPSDQAQLLSTVLAIDRLLDATDDAVGPYRTIH